MVPLFGLCVAARITYDLSLRLVDPSLVRLNYNVALYQNNNDVAVGKSRGRIIRFFRRARRSLTATIYKPKSLSSVSSFLVFPDSLRFRSLFPLCWLTLCWCPVAQATDIHHEC